MPLEIVDERCAPGLARFRIAKRVELEHHSLGDAELAQQLIAEAQQLDVRLRLGRTDDLGVELVEFAEAALLRPLVAERRALRRELQRSKLLPAFRQIGPT